MKEKELLAAIYNKIVGIKSWSQSSLIVGELGSLLFQLEHNSYLNIQNDDIQERLISTSNDLLSKNDPTFSQGISGLGWVLQYFTNKNLIDAGDVSGVLRQIDEIAYTSAMELMSNNNHDFLHGALGNGTFLVSRQGYNPDVDKYISDIIEKLHLLSKESEKGIYWEETNFNPYDKNNKVIVLGLAHGIASKIAFLSNQFKTRRTKSVNELLTKSIEFLLNSKFVNDRYNISMFPVYEIDDNLVDKSRLAWCHGDLGIGMALYHAGITMNDEKLINESIGICLETTKRKSKETTQILDAGLCHGTSGLMLMYDMLYSKTKIEAFKESAEFWYDYTFRNVSESDLTSLDAWDNIDKQMVTDRGLLYGLSGIGLSLISYMKKEYRWTNCLLLG